MRHKALMGTALLVALAVAQALVATQICDLVVQVAQVACHREVTRTFALVDPEVRRLVVTPVPAAHQALEISLATRCRDNNPLHLVSEHLTDWKREEAEKQLCVYSSWIAFKCNAKVAVV